MRCNDASSNNNTATSTTAACGVPRQQHTRLLAYVVNCTIPRQHSTATHTHSCNSSTHTPTHTHMCDCKKFFNKIKFNAAKCSSALELVSLRFHFALQIALQTPLLTTTSSQSSVRPAGQARPETVPEPEQSQCQRQIKPESASASVQTTNANELQNAMQCNA